MKFIISSGHLNIKSYFMPDMENGAKTAFIE
jgi:hypothetical protein